MRSSSLAFVLASLAWLVGSCGGSADMPEISSFVAEPVAVQAGGKVRLTARFSGGAGQIDHGIGAMGSGVPVEAVVQDDTTYMLTVSGGGMSVSASAAVAVVYDVLWEFNDAAGWALDGNGVARTEGGMLRLETHLSAEPFAIDPPQQNCSRARATAAYGDAKLAAGRYATVVYEFRGMVHEGSGTRTLTVIYNGQRVGFNAPAGTARVEWTKPSLVRLSVDGNFDRILTPTEVSLPNAVIAEARDCPVAGGGARNGVWRIDAVAVSAR